MNPRRLDIESYRDSLLRAAGRLDSKMYGPSEDVDDAASVRRTVYGRDQPRPHEQSSEDTMTSRTRCKPAAGRDLTTTSLQQLFVMNSGFMHDEAQALVANSVQARRMRPAKMRGLYHKVLSRNPSPKELDLALSYLADGHVWISTRRSC